MIRNIELKKKSTSKKFRSIGQTIKINFLYFKTQFWELNERSKKEINSKFDGDNSLLIIKLKRFHSSTNSGCSKQIS